MTFVRIDNRLIHGQILTAWLQEESSCNTLILANDEVSADPIMSSILSAAVPAGWDLKIVGVDGVAGELTASALDHEKVFVIVKTPQDALRLARQPVGVRHINVGNMHHSKGKRKLSPHVFVDDDDLACLVALSEMEFAMDARWLPDERITAIESLLGKR